MFTSKEGRYHTAVTQWMHQSNWKSSSFVQKMELTNVNKTFSSLSLTLNSKGADYMNWLIKNRCFKGWQDISLWACRHYLSPSKKTKALKRTRLFIYLHLCSVLRLSRLIYWRVCSCEDGFNSQGVWVVSGGIGRGDFFIYLFFSPLRF